MPKCIIVEPAKAELVFALKQLREQKIAAEYAEAANDPLFIRDLNNCMRDWAELDRDSLQYLDCEPDESL